MGTKAGWEGSWALHWHPYFCLSAVLALEGPEIVHTKFTHSDPPTCTQQCGQGVEPGLATFLGTSDPSLGDMGACGWDRSWGHPRAFTLQNWVSGTTSRAECVHTVLSQSSLRVNSSFQPQRKI